LGYAPLSKQKKYRAKLKRGQVMKQFTSEQVIIELASALNLLNKHNPRKGDHYAAYIGLDVHKKTIAVAIAYRERGKPISRTEIVNTPKTIRQLVAQLN
jgi:hypothetical protein